MAEKYYIIEILILVSAFGVILGLLKGLPPEGKFVQIMRNILIVSACIMGLLILTDYYG